ncbi:MAG: hypothetical protein JXB05_34355 [Myxococcaceae bacterium]|nr:hypothetical protein [Myxococcaceae bacterium]
MSPSQRDSRSASRSALQLLLASAEEHRPVLEEGLAAEATWDAPKPELLPGRVEVPTWERPDAAPNDLEAQRWGVIAPEGTLGDALLHAIAPLIEHRGKEQNAPVKTYRVPSDMNAAAAVQWREKVLQAEGVPEEERPWYLLILGDLHHVSIELQQVLAQGACVGRLHVGSPSGEPDLAGYAAYARKALAHARRTPEEETPSLLLYTAQDGTAATSLGHQLLVEPCLEAMRTRWKAKWPTLDPRLIPYESEGPDALLRAAGEARAGVMLSVSHGLGRPRSGWASPEQQRATQGALLVGGGLPLTGDKLREAPFLPGGMWFVVACFGAATPAKSAFHAWLSQLKNAGKYPGRPEQVLSKLPGPGERPFVAALPQALLANEQGPLAIIGHSDLAWTLSFTDEGSSVSRASRILSALEVLANGSRAGVALAALMRAYRAANESLMAGYQAREDALLYGTPDPTDPVRHGSLWLQRNDLRGYLLLGDPAARLPMKRTGP